MVTRKNKVKVGDRITFRVGNRKKDSEGTVTWIGDAALTVFPHTIAIKDQKGNPMDTQWFVELSDITIVKG